MGKNGDLEEGGIQILGFFSFSVNGNVEELVTHVCCKAHTSVIFWAIGGAMKMGWNSALHLMVYSGTFVYCC